jgi:hypothetical protein
MLADRRTSCIELAPEQLPWRRFRGCTTSSFPLCRANRSASGFESRCRKWNMQDCGRFGQRRGRFRRESLHGGAGQMDKRGPGYDASAAADSAGNSPRPSIARFPSYLASSTANAGERVAKPEPPPKLNLGELLNLPNPLGTSRNPGSAMSPESERLPERGRSNRETRCCPRPSADAWESRQRHRRIL